MIDLDDGTFKFGGGSTNAKLSFDGTTLSVNGTVTATAGSIADFQIVSKTLTTTSIYGGYAELYTIYCDSNGNPGTLSILQQDTPFRQAQAVTSQGKFQTNAYDGTGTTSIRIGGYGNNGTSVGLEAISISMRSASYLAINTNGIIQGDCNDISDERMKSDIIQTETLERLKRLSVTEWRYDDEKIKRITFEKAVNASLKVDNKILLNAGLFFEELPEYTPSHRHIGPMAKDFNQLFGVSNGDEGGINLSDGIGVALRAIQELAEIFDDQKAEIAELRAALNLPKKQEREKKEVERELSDEEKEILHMAENRARKAILKRLLEAEKK